MIEHHVYTGSTGAPAGGIELMGWTKVDDAFLCSPRVTMAAGILGRGGRARAVSVWLEGLTHANRHLTDGRLATGDVRLFIMDAKPLRVAAALATAGLWEAVDGGWRIRGYLDHYPDADTIRRRKEAAPSRGRRAGGRSAPDSDSDSDSSTDLLSDIAAATEEGGSQGGQQQQQQERIEGLLRACAARARQAKRTFNVTEHRAKLAAGEIDVDDLQATADELQDLAARFSRRSAR